MNPCTHSTIWDLSAETLLWKRSNFSHRHYYHLGLNQMSNNLGLDETMFDNEEAVSDFIGIVSQDFDLVMIAEHMEVSLKFLADKMQWPLEQVV